MKRVISIQHIEMSLFLQFDMSEPVKFLQILSYFHFNYKMAGYNPQQGQAEIELNFPEHCLFFMKMSLLKGEYR